jgi:hypothetical protein
VLLRRRLAVLVAAAMMVASMLAFSAPTFADKGGTPNAKACHGQAVSAANRIEGVTPHEAVQFLNAHNPEQPPLENAGEFNKLVKEGVIEYETPSGEVISCAQPS